MITLEQFIQILPECEEPEEWFDILSNELLHWELDTNEQIACFIAQTAHESAEYNVLAENLNYSSDRLMVVFPKYFRNVQNIRSYHRQPERIANRVYANRMGNGDEDSGDGYKYRGRGVLQITGKNNYAKCSEFLFGHDDVLLDDPDLLLTKPNALGAAFWYWDINEIKDVDDFIHVTKIVNGGLNGLKDRQHIYDRALYVLSSTT